MPLVIGFSLKLKYCLLHVLVSNRKIDENSILAWVKKILEIQGWKDYPQTLSLSTFTALQLNVDVY